MLLIIDANILIDMESGNLLERLFQLPIRIAIPDILYREEIEPGTPGLEFIGLCLLEITGEYVAYALSLSNKYGNGPSHNDYFALALAKQEGCPLLTGDKQLRKVALSEEVSTMGTIWLTVSSCFSHSMVFQIKPIVNFAPNSYIFGEMRVL